MIAIDIMGGDFAPRVVLEGAVQAAREGCEVCLFGPENDAITWLNEHVSDWKQLPISFVQAAEVIGMADEPVSAVRKKQDSSLVKAIANLAQDKVDAVVSAGNSGALMVASVFILGRQDGVERPAIAGLFPATDGSFVVGLDLGANTDCKPHHLVQFAQLGVDYAKRMLNKENPRLALLANGEEDVKGSLLTKEVFQLLKQASFNFIGNREPHDVLSGSIDVFVCDGFTGNIFLKTYETIFSQKIKRFKRLLTEEATKEPAFAPILNRLMQQLDASNIVKEMGGALLVGVKKPVFVCHGAAQADDIENAIKTAKKYAESAKNK
ncbi:phosphate acyltransferase PlsX [Candidatus Dependentiae bacterium]|nr:phosphate acyltransferase PlsX [Candidatus Dependentiae bacterium]